MVDELDEGVEPDERRRYDRSRLIVDVFFDGSDATGVASTKDISVGGFYMNTQAKLPEGQCSCSHPSAMANRLLRMLK